MYKKYVVTGTYVRLSGEVDHELTSLSLDKVLTSFTSDTTYKTLNQNTMGYITEDSP